VIDYRDSHEIDLEQLATLFVSAGWEHRTRDRHKLALLVGRSLYVSFYALNGFEVATGMLWCDRR
jgi:hypothetical protein